jgi:magnesium transporter
MISVYVHRGGGTHCVDRVEPGWLDPSSGVTFWVDLADPTPEEGRLLSDLFRFHPLAVEDAMSVLQFPKVEPYQNFLYLVLHGIDVTAGSGSLTTHDIDFFLGPNYLVTVHGNRSRSIARLRGMCDKHGHILQEGAVSLLHRIIDAIVDNYRPVIEEVEDRLSKLEEQAFVGHESMVRQLLKLRRDLSWLRRVLIPQRDAIGRLARREFAAISDEMAYRFRDVYDHVIRLTEEAILFQERITGILEVNLSTISNRLNQVVKVLTVMSTIFLPLTVLTSMWGMNIPLPHFPGGEAAQFWWIGGIMVALIVGMLAVFRSNRWI